MAEKTQEEMLAEQKKNCIFCQIVEGKTPSKKIYEDDLMMAILDINPARKGHVLVMSKEHYPIMPLIPPKTFKHLFNSAAQLTGAIKKGVLAEESLIFIANGGVAGQQSPHFLFHIIPRDKGEVTKLDIPKNNKDQSDLSPSMKHNLTLMMKNHLSKEGKLNLLDTDDLEKPIVNAEENHLEESQDEKVKSEKELKKVTVFNEEQVNALAEMIEQNPELKALLINNPEKLQEIVNTNPEFKNLFAGIDIKALGEQVKKQYFEQQTTQEEQLEPVNKEIEKVEEKSFDNTKTSEESDVPKATEMDNISLKNYVDSKEKLKHYLFEDVETLKELIPNHERLSIFFEGTSPEEVLERYKQEEPGKGASLDDIASYLGGGK